MRKNNFSPLKTKNTRIDSINALILPFVIFAITITKSKNKGAKYGNICRYNFNILIVVPLIKRYNK